MICAQSMLAMSMDSDILRVGHKELKLGHHNTRMYTKNGVS